MRSLSFYFFLFPSILAYKILVYSPTNSRSHMISNGRIADELALAGHNVTLLEVEILIKSSEFKSANHAKIVSLGGLKTENFKHGVDLLSSLAFKENVGWFDNLIVYSKWQQAFNEMCDQFLENHRDALDGLKEEKFDIVFAEQLDLCGTALKEALKIKTHLWISSCPLMDHMAWILGVPTPLSYVPVVGDMDISDKPSYIERIWNIIEYIGDVYVYKQGISEITQIYRKHYGENFPDAEQIARDSPITFVLADEFLDFPRPILHNTIYIGGVGIKNNTKGLPEPYKTELEKGKKGVVFFSLGSNANTKNIPYEFKKNLFEAFKNLPEYHFLVKINEGDLEGEELAKSISNLFIFQWAPQPDILAHPKLKAFITHGGYNSLIESARTGVPIVSFPFFVDQWRNGRVAERNGWGVTFDKKKLLHGSKEFLEALKKILEDPSYQEKAQRTKRLLSTKPFSSSEKFIKFVEFVAENDGILPELQNEGRNLNFFVYHNLDIFVPIIAIILFLVYLTWKIVSYLIFCIFHRKSKILKVKKQ